MRGGGRTEWTQVQKVMMVDAIARRDEETVAHEARKESKGAAS